jgi:hypothetical protein
VDLVDEEDVAGLERGQDGRDVLLLERRAGDRPEPDPELLADDLRERRLPEARRAGEQDVVERLAPRLCGVQRDRELLFHALLADEVVESPRPQRPLGVVLLGPERRREELTHAAAPRSASRTRSSAGRSGSISASARSASSTE